MSRFDLQKLARVLALEHQDLESHGTPLPVLVAGIYAEILPVDDAKFRAPGDIDALLAGRGGLTQVRFSRTSSGRLPSHSRTGHVWVQNSQ